MCIYLDGFDFDGPYPLDRWTPPHEQGVYALLQRTEAPDHTVAYTPVYFGQVDDLAACDLRTEHPRSACWTKEAGSRENLYIGIHYMPGATEFLRHMVEDTLLAQYHPVCNYQWSWSPQGGAVHRLYT